MPWGVLLWVYPVWDSLGFLDLGDHFLPHFREVFNYYLLKYFLMVFMSSSSGTPMIRMLGLLTLSQRSLGFSSFLLIHFSFFLSDSFISTILSSTLLILSSASIILLFVPSRVFLISLLHYSLYIDFFISSRSLLNLSCIFSILVSRLFICDSISISRFSINFTIIIRNSLSGRFLISSSFVWFGGHLSCSFTC